MKPNRSIPPSTVIPVLVYPDVREVVAGLSAAFGFAERTRIGESHRAQMSIGEDGAMIVADVRGCPPVIIWPASVAWHPRVRPKAATVRSRTRVPFAYRSRVLGSARTFE